MALYHGGSAKGFMLPNGEDILLLRSRLSSVLEVGEIGGSKEA